LADPRVEAEVADQLLGARVQIPTEVGQGYQGEAGQHSEMMSATVPI
jgi:hypothetical protein